MTSKRTKVVAVRLSNELYEKIDKRLEKRGRDITMSDYLRDRITYDIERKHRKRK